MIARYAVENAIEFIYSAPVHSSVMTLYVCPLQGRRQQVGGFRIETDPPGPVFDFDGSFGNRGHFLGRPGEHRRLLIRASATVEVGPVPAWPDRLDGGPAPHDTSARDGTGGSGGSGGTGGDPWKALGRAVAANPELGLMLQPSRFARPSPALEEFCASGGLEAGDDPLAGALSLRGRLHELFAYIPGTTTVDSPIEQILDSRQGVCQDYAHVMAAILRGWGIPARYVSGYLGPGWGGGGSGPGAENGGEAELGTGSRGGSGLGAEGGGKSEPGAGSGQRSGPGAQDGGGDLAIGQSHAWVEGWFPGVGWIGFDAVHDCHPDLRHIRVAVGRDYGDVPPTRGVFQGTAESELRTQVRIVREETSL